jgi:hypothetical protein
MMKGKITDRMKKLAHIPSGVREDGIPMTCLEDSSLPWADSKP